MNESSKRTSRYAVGGAVILCLFIVLGWFALRPELPLPNQQPIKVEAVKPVVPVFEPTDDLSSETPTNQPNDSAPPNAADLYRQAFALYGALTNDEKEILRDWRTNVDASVEAELCEKIRPVCDLMHHASAVTNCDWGIDSSEPKFLRSILNPGRNIGRAMIWSAARCRSNDVTGATEDVLSTLQLGRNISRLEVIGCLVDLSLQYTTSSYVSQHVGLFGDADGQRLAASFNNPAYKEASSDAMEEEANRVDHITAQLAVLPAEEVAKAFSENSGWMNDLPPNMDQATVLVALKQVADSERELATALASSSQDEYKAWQQHVEELETSNPLAAEPLSAWTVFLDKMRAAEVNRQLLVAGLAVAQEGADALPSHLDPSSGEPFTYTETDDGFELRSNYQFNKEPMMMQFK
jgi:hypothetical protein